MQTAYTENYAEGRIGMIADSGNRRVESKLSNDSSAIQFGRGVAKGADAELNVENFYQEIATVTYDIDFEASNSIAFSVNGVAITPVVYASSQADTLAALVAAVDGLSGVSAVASTTKGLIVTRRVIPADTSADIVALSTVTLGTNQAVATYAYSTDQVFAGATVKQDNAVGGEIVTDDNGEYGDCGAMTQGVLWCELVSGQTPAVDGSVYVVSTGTDRGKFTTVDDTTTEAVTSAKFKSTVETFESLPAAKIEFNRP